MLALLLQFVCPSLGKTASVARIGSLKRLLSSVVPKRGPRPVVSRAPAATRVATTPGPLPAATRTRAPPHDPSEVPHHYVR